MFLTSLRYGIAPTSALSFATYGMMVAGIFGSYEKGYSYGELGIKLFEKMQTREVEATILVSFNLYLRPWKEPVRATLPSLVRAYQSGVDAGNLEFAVHGAMAYCYCAFLAGVELPQVKRDMEKYGEAIENLDHRGNTYIHSLYHQVVSNLVHEDPDASPWRLKGEFYDDDEMLVQHRQNSDAAGLFLTYYQKAMLAFLFEQYDLAKEWSDNAKNAFTAGIGTYNSTVFYFYRALTLLAQINTCSRRDRRRYIKEVHKIQKNFRKWGSPVPRIKSSVYSSSMRN